MLALPKLEKQVNREAFTYLSLRLFYKTPAFFIASKYNSDFKNFYTVKRDHKENPSLFE
jgi:hypothetical protein